MSTIPIRIDPTNFSRQSASEINPMGPFLFGGKQYWVGSYNINATAGVRQLAIFSSSNQWTSNTELDSAHAPTPLVGLGTGPIAVLNVYFDPAGIISVLYTLTDLTSHIIEFTCGPDTYGTPGAGLAGGIIDGLNHFWKRTDGTYVVLYGLGGNFLRRTYAAGSWAGPTTVAATQYSPAGKLYDTATGITHLAFTHISTLYYAQLSPTYVLSTPIALSVTTDGLRASLVFFDAGIAIGNSSGIVYEGFASGVFPYFAYVSIAPDRSAPVFTTYTIFTGNGDDAGVGDAPTYVTLLVDDAGRLNAFFVETDYSVSPIVDRLWRTIFNGSGWGSLILLYDAVANPPINSVSDFDQFIHTGDAALDGGKLVIPIALETLDSAQNHCTGFMLVLSLNTVLLNFNLKGSQPPGSPSGTLLSPNPSGPGPGPILNPVQCIIQFDLDAAGVPTGSGGGSSPPPPPPPPPPPLVPVIMSLTIPGGTEGFGYSFQIVATNSPTAWTATGLPTGMFIGPKNGNLVGTPTASGTFSVVIVASNSSGSSAPVTYSLDVGSTGVAPTITTTSPLPPGNAGSPYHIQFTATGTNPIDWDGIVPDGIVGSGGNLTWTNPIAGTYTLQMRATNAAGTTGLLPFVLVISNIPLPPPVPGPPG